MTKALVFGLHALDWSTAQDMSFTAIELAYKAAVEWAEEAAKHRK